MIKNIFRLFLNLLILYVYGFLGLFYGSNFILYLSIFMLVYFLSVNVLYAYNLYRYLFKILYSFSVVFIPFIGMISAYIIFPYNEGSFYVVNYRMVVFIFCFNLIPFILNLKILSKLKFEKNLKRIEIDEKKINSLLQHRSYKKIIFILFAYAVLLFFLYDLLDKNNNNYVIIFVWTVFFSYLPAIIIAYAFWEQFFILIKVLYYEIKNKRKIILKKSVLDNIDDRKGENREEVN